MGKSQRSFVWTCMPAAVVMLAAGGCSERNEAVANRADTATEATAASGGIAPTPTAPAGPDMLTTVGDAGAPLTKVAAQQGLFAIENVDGVDMLTVNGKPARFTASGTNAPQPVAANSGISLIGVFELPQESVAWVTIIGGAACPGTHVLVGARNGRALPGQEIPGCDDRGTMRRNGDKIAFEAGGSEGTYEDGMISVTAKPAEFGQGASGTAM